MNEVILRPHAPNKTSMRVFLAEEKCSRAGIIIFPGGGYWDKAEHEGSGYADFLNKNGYNAFVVQYTTRRQRDSYFPEQLLDARAAVRYLRANAEKYGLDSKKIYVMGSSAGGHLAALVCTCRERFGCEADENDQEEDFIPDGQILCYPVIELYGKNAHVDSAKNLLGKNYSEENCRKYSPDLCVKRGAPPAFIWHTFADSCVRVENSLEYCLRLKEVGTETELHIFPMGEHGLGLADDPSRKNEYVSKWSELLLAWLKEKER